MGPLHCRRVALKESSRLLMDGAGKTGVEVMTMEGLRWPRRRPDLDIIILGCAVVKQVQSGNLADGMKEDRPSGEKRSSTPARIVGICLHDFALLNYDFFLSFSSS